MKNTSLQIAPNHIALLVPSVRKAADRLRNFDYNIGQEEDFEGEGTREIYVEYGKANALLLLEPIKPGAYQRAMEKRGPGIHHFAVDVLDLDSFLSSLPAGGWLRHPVSTKTIKESRTAWLFRKGFPALIEVHERGSLNPKLAFITKINLPIGGAELTSLLQGVGLVESVGLSAPETNFEFSGGQKIYLREFI